MFVWRVLVQEVNDSVIAVLVASSGLKGKLEFQIVLLKSSCCIVAYLGPFLALVHLLSTKMVHVYDKSMNLCQITTNPKTNIFGYGAKPNSPLEMSTAQALKWPT